MDLVFRFSKNEADNCNLGLGDEEEAWVYKKDDFEKTTGADQATLFT